MAPPQLPAWSNQHEGSALNLTGYTRVFSDEFSTSRLYGEDWSVLGKNGDRIAPTGSWFAPVHAPFGVAAFVDPGDTGVVNPFKVANGSMTITLQKVAGQWQSGLMQSADWRNQGTLQQDGYFEMRAKFPGDRGAWPAFWLISQNTETGERIEVDIVEAYGGDKGHHASLHLQTGAGRTSLSDYTGLNGAMHDGGFHTYGGLITGNWLVTYFDGKEMGRMDISGIDAFDRANFHMIVSLAAHPHIAQADDAPKSMVIDYVRTYKAGPGALEPGAGGADETLQGTRGNDVLHGNDGDDCVYGGLGDDALFGDTGNDALHGGSGNDRFDGGDGCDWLSGGRGRDSFVFDNRLGSDNVDTIADFSVRDDTIVLENYHFTGLVEGALARGAFYRGAKAHDASDRILYDSRSGALSYDADGTGAAAPIKFAQLPQWLSLTHADFLII